MQKSPDAFRTISEVAEELDLPQHVLRFWETRFSTIRPLKRGGGRRYYRPDDIDLLKGIRHLLYGQGYTIKGVQRILREQGLRSVQALGRGEQPALPVTHEPSDDEEDAGQESHDAIEEAIDDAAAPAPDYADDRSGAGPLRHDEVPVSAAGRDPAGERPEPHGIGRRAGGGRYRAPARRARRIARMRAHSGIVAGRIGCPFRAIVRASTPSPSLRKDGSRDTRLVPFRPTNPASPRPIDSRSVVRTK